MKVNVLIAMALLLSAVVSAADLPVNDVVLVVDNSGSMKKNDAEQLAPQAVHNFIQHLAPDDRASLLIFDESVRIVLPLTARTALDNETLQAALSMIDYRGQWTNSPAAIERAIYELIHEGRAEASKSILFLTDGLVDTGDSADDQEAVRWAKGPLADQAVAEEIKIFGVAFSDQADFSLIQTLAAKTDASYFRVVEADKLDATFNEIMGLLITVEPSVESLTEPVELVQVEVEPEPEPVIVVTMMPMVESELSVDAVEVIDPPEVVEIDSASSEEEVAGLVEPVEQIQSDNGGYWNSVALVSLLVIVALVLLGYRRSKSKNQQAAIPVDDDDLFIFPQDDTENDDVAAVMPVSALDIDIGHGAYLVDESGVSGQKELPVAEGTTIIGRLRGSTDQGEHFIVIDDATISRRHAVIHYRDLAYWISDQNSANETFVNDKKVEHDTYMKNGDVIGLGRFRFVFHLPDMDVGEETIEFGLPRTDDSGVL